MNGGVLALDLSTKTGWAHGYPGDPRPSGGVWHLPPMSDLGKCFAALENELDDLLTLLRPDEVVQEAPLQIYDRSTLLLFGLSAHVQSTCYRHDIVCRSASVNDARGAILGRSKFPTGLAKTYVLNWCREQGYEPVDDNHGDALLLWRFWTQDMLPLRRVA